MKTRTVSLTPEQDTRALAIDVVVVNYNSGEILNQCLSCLCSDEAYGEIVVIDNGSNDDSLSHIVDYNSKIKLIKNKENRGFAVACNQGAKLGQADMIAFVNPDCFVSPKQLQQLVQTLRSKPDAALVGCQVLNADGSIQAATRRRLPTFWRVVFHLSGLSKLPGFKGININDAENINQTIEVEAVNGACYVVRRADFAELQGFDESYPLHFEDLDLFARFKGISKTLWYDPSVKVEHLQGHAQQEAQQVSQWKAQGLKRYFTKHRPAWEARLIRWLLKLKGH